MKLSDWIRTKFAPGLTLTYEMPAAQRALAREQVAAGTALSGRKTVLIVTPYAPPDGGGLERYAFTTGRLLQERHGWRVVMVVPAPRGQNSFQEVVDGMMVYRLGRPLRPANMLFNARWRGELRRIIRWERPDLINAHMPVPGLADLSARVRGRVPLVITYHGGSMVKRPAQRLVGMRLNDWTASKAVRLYEHWLLPRTLKRAGKIICSAEFAREEFLKAYQERSVVITPGVDQELFKPAGDGSSGPGMAKRVLFVGSYGPAHRQKGLERLLRAVAPLTERYPGLRVEVMGQGDDTYYQAMAEQLGIAERLKFLGPKSGEDLARGYQTATVMALPTSNDSFPRVLMEAMACAKPVISTPVGGIPSLVRDGQTGLLVDPDDTAALTVALDRLLGDHVYARQLGENGRRVVETELGWEKKAAQTAAVFEAQIERNRRLRILILTPGSAGSSLTHRALSLGQAWAKAGHEVTLMAPSADKYNSFQRDTRREIDGVKLIHPAQPATRWHWFNLLPYIPDAAVKVLVARADVVYLCKPTPMTMVGVLAKGRRPLVLDMDDTGSQIMAAEGYSKWEVALTDWSERRAKRAADALIVESTYLRQRYRRCLPEKTVTWVPNGVNVAKYKVKEQTQAPKVVFFDNIGQEGVYEPLVRTLPSVLARRPETEVVVIGDGPKLSRMKVLATELGVDGALDFLGRLDIFGAQDFMRAGDIGYSYMPDEEAVRAASNRQIFQFMAMGVLPLISDVGDQATYIGGGAAGYVCPPGDMNALARTLLTALNEPAKVRAERINQARELAWRYDWQVLAGEAESVLREVII